MSTEVPGPSGPGGLVNKAIEKLSQLGKAAGHLFRKDTDSKIEFTGRNPLFEPKTDAAQDEKDVSFKANKIVNSDEPETDVAKTPSSHWEKVKNVTQKFFENTVQSSKNLFNKISNKENIQIPLNHAKLEQLKKESPETGVFDHVRQVFRESIPNEKLSFEIEGSVEYALKPPIDKLTYDQNHPEQIIHVMDVVDKTDIAIASGYGLDPLDSSKRAGDPIADYMRVERYPGSRPSSEVIIFSGADGSGWGINASMSARIATDTFLETTKAHLRTDVGIQTAKQLGQVFIDGLQSAHNSIIDDANGALTTHLGIVGQKESDGSFKGMASSIGDQKLFILRKSGQVEEITHERRQKLTSSVDTGGSLGNSDPEGDPNLQNLSMYIFKAEEGDILLPMSDGIHDNLDPQSEQYHPQAAVKYLLDSPLLLDKERKVLENLNLLKNNVTDWEELSGDKIKAELSQLKSIYQRHRIQEIALNHPEGTSIAEALVEHAYSLTSLERAYKQKGETPSSRSAAKSDDMKWMGKLDHFSCASITI